MPNNKRDLSLDMTGLELPVSGDLRYSSGPSGSILEANIKKTFGGEEGSITPSIGYTDQRGNFSDDFLSSDVRSKTISAGVDGDLQLMDGDLDLTGSLFGAKTFTDENVNTPSMNQTFSNSNVGTFTKIGIGARMGMFDVTANRQKQSGSDPYYSGTLGINIGKGGRFEYSDSNKSDPTIGFNYNLSF